MTSVGASGLGELEPRAAEPTGAQGAGAGEAVREIPTAGDGPAAPVAAADAPPTSSFVVELAHYSGPLDLLLALIRDEQVDV